MVERRLVKNFDFALLFAALAIVAFGCVMIYSAKGGGAVGADYLRKQVMWAFVGLGLGTAVASINHTVYARYAGKIYAFGLFLLVLVLAVGQEINGAKSWIRLGGLSLQPSELVKISIIISLAVFLVHRREEIRTFNVFAKSLLYVSVPLVLVLAQPDLGTSLAVISIWLTTVFVMGTNIKNILLFGLAGVVLALTAWYTPGVLKDYQKNRVITLVNPAADPLGAGYHVTQSRIAIGSGRMLGKGYLQGTQSKLKYVPEQHTDFIFSVLGEEMGFVGTVTLTTLCFIVLWRGLIIMAAAEDMVGRGIAAGVVGMFGFHVLENIGMTIGIMPVTGVPLSMFSYGGSALMANLMAIGLLQGISMRRHKISF